MVAMPLTANEVFLARRALRDNGFQYEEPEQDGWLVHSSYVGNTRCFASKIVGRYAAASPLAHVGAALREEGAEQAATPGPLGFPAFLVDGDAALGVLVRRIFELTRSLPSEPWDLFVQDTKDLPVETEAQRLVVQRRGQDRFRDALIAYWGGACAVTSMDQLELLRASHIKPWAACADHPRDRLDVHNGLLLRADFDAAFDAGLITFDDQGGAVASATLSEKASKHFSDARIDRLPRLTGAHRQFLQWHRSHVFRAA